MHKSSLSRRQQAQERKPVRRDDRHRSQEELLQIRGEWKHGEFSMQMQLT